MIHNIKQRKYTKTELICLHLPNISRLQQGKLRHMIHFNQQWLHCKCTHSTVVNDERNEQECQQSHGIYESSEFTWI